MAIYHKNSDRTIETITKAYDKAVKDIEEEIRKIYDKFSTAGKLSPREARKLLNSKISVKELNRIRNKIKHIQDEDIKRRLLSILNAPAYKARITRLEALKQDIYIQSKMIADVELRASTSQYIDTINEAYYKQIYDIQKGLGIGFDIAAMSTRTIETILKNPWSGKHFSERIWHNTDVLAEKLTEIITSGFMSGKSIDKMARELQEYTEYGKYAAIRLVRTETTYMANAAEMESYKECGIEKYIYVATLDNRTSTICQSLDRKVFNVKDGVAGKNMPPMHPFCRSTTRAYLGPDTLKGIKRRARDPKTGKTYLVPADMNYKEWYQKYVVDKYGKDQAEIMKKKLINKASDKKQYKRYKEVLGKDMPVKTFDKFQDLKYNDIERWRKIKRSYGLIKLEKSKIDTVEKAKEYIELLDKTIHEGKQGKHIIGHNNFIDGRSYLTISIEKAQELVNKYAGTGKLQFNKKGEWNKKELIIIDREIGVNVNNNTGEKTPTNKFIIHYSKSGTHIVPTLKER
ncbi:phage putative head morphogenesis protein, SPP1 gp7 family [Caminicella sporogenes DSM 14501]|uniref:Phage putative head morphogenesis protein, SPP1 gp7 family n=2 Tax=Caminicella TaxID=166484 RepID=A0A1M6MYA3_9FIRM|nr:phage putative head morphogenesis protein, SPP1 gp7 family [Caminicella sporogenes DSM 14501]